MSELTRETLRHRHLHRFSTPVHVNGSGETLVDGWVRRLAAAHLGVVSSLADKASNGDEGASVELVGRMVCYCLTDADGNRIYSDDDLPEVLDADFAILQAIAEQALEHSGIGATEGDAGN